MKLSIIVPVYNAEKFLVKCMDSLLGQTIDDYEVIAINDGSTDSSLDILNGYAEKYPRKLKIYTLTNGGQGRARNYGIDHAEGEYIGFADSDDWVEPDMFEKLYNAAVSENADIVFCDCRVSCDNGTSRIIRTTADEDKFSTGAMVWDKLYKRSLIGDVRFPEKVWYEDLYFVVALVSKTDAVYVLHEPLYNYRVGHTSTMNNNRARKNLDIIRVVELLREHTDRKEFERLILNDILIDTVNRLSGQSNSERREIIREVLNYVHREIPCLSESVRYREESFSRRIAMWLNYNGMYEITRIILKLKGAS